MRDIMKYKILITCERAGNTIPPDHLNLFQNHNSILETHWGYDPGALSLAQSISEQFKIQMFYTKYSRLLIDCNRSLHNPRVFSQYTKVLPSNQRENIIKNYYHPFRIPIAQGIADSMKNNQSILHLSVHTFTPKLHEKMRNADIGILYDPQRVFEKLLCKKWKNVLNTLNPQLRVRLNYPYRGNADGHTTALRKQFSEEHYMGIELEVNHFYYFQSAEQWEQVIRCIVQSIHLLVE